MGDTVIDVWWMIDDGGLCMLIPYIMTMHKFWARCKLRMLMVAAEDDVSGDISTMKGLIKQFRLPYEGPLLVSAKQAPHSSTVAKYEKLAGCKLSETPRPSVVKKWLILSELLFEYSRYSGLNVVTLPIPTKACRVRRTWRCCTCSATRTACRPRLSCAATERTRSPSSLSNSCICFLFIPFFLASCVVSLFFMLVCL